VSGREGYKQMLLSAGEEGQEGRDGRWGGDGILSSSLSGPMEKGVGLDSYLLVEGEKNINKEIKAFVQRPNPQFF